MSDDKGGTVECEPLPRYNEASARTTVQRRNARYAALVYMMVACGDHWHVIEQGHPMAAQSGQTS